MIFFVICIVSGALIIGALWGLYGQLQMKPEGFMVALAGGALIVSLVMELIYPALQESTAPLILLLVLAGAAVFTALDYLIDQKWGPEQGAGLLLAITLDGIPENLALGVSLIHSSPVEIAALAGAILLSNLPEAAGGARQMKHSQLSGLNILVLWSATAVLLSGAALIGYFTLEDASPHFLGGVKAFAAGAVIASLATEVFPTAYKEDHHMAGIATALGVILAFALYQWGQ